MAPPECQGCQFCSTGRISEHFSLEKLLLLVSPEVPVVHDYHINLFLPIAMRYVAAILKEPGQRRRTLHECRSTQPLKDVYKHSNFLNQQNNQITRRPFQAQQGRSFPAT